MTSFLEFMWRVAIFEGQQNGNYGVGKDQTEWKILENNSCDVSFILCKKPDEDTMF